MNKKTEPTPSERLQMQALKFGLLMDDAKDYLMKVDQKHTSVAEVVETTLEKLGFGRNGLQDNFSIID